MMTQEKTEIEAAAAPDSINFATLGKGVVVIKVVGRGNFQNSVELKRLAENMANRTGDFQTRFIMDMHECISMDSTFMGVLASMALRQLKDSGNRLTVIRANPQNVRLLETLGLAHFMTIRTSESSPALTECEFRCADSEDVGKVDRIVHMIEAHENLCSADSENNLRFESVLKYLKESLDREEP
jgi:anti-anti-sigma factor